jgi:hypothetical protein
LLFIPNIKLTQKQSFYIYASIVRYYRIGGIYASNLSRVYDGGIYASNISTTNQKHYTQYKKQPTIKLKIILS